MNSYKPAISSAEGTNRSGHAIEGHGRFTSLTIHQLGHQVLSASKTFPQASLLRCRPLSSRSFRFVPLSFRMSPICSRSSSTFSPRSLLDL